MADWREERAAMERASAERRAQEEYVDPRVKARLEANAAQVRADRLAAILRQMKYSYDPERIRQGVIKGNE
jgi:hypothetical protein